MIERGLNDADAEVRRFRRGRAPATDARIDDRERMLEDRAGDKEPRVRPKRCAPGAGSSRRLVRADSRRAQGRRPARQLQAIDQLGAAVPPANRRPPT